MNITERLSKDFPGHGFYLTEETTGLKLGIDGMPATIQYSLYNEKIENPELDKNAEEILYLSLKEHVLQELRRRENGILLSNLSS